MFTNVYADDNFIVDVLFCQCVTADEGVSGSIVANNNLSMFPDLENLNAWFWKTCLRCFRSVDVYTTQLGIAYVRHRTKQ